MNSLDSLPHLAKVSEEIEQDEEAEEEKANIGIQADPRSRKARVKNSNALVTLCNKYGTTLDESNVRVCEGRKVVYVLKVGEITEEACFLRENPTPSQRAKSMDSSATTTPKSNLWSSVMIPNGWKVAVVVDRNPWTAQAEIVEGLLKFRFTFVDPYGKETDQCSDWCETPGAAFKSLFTKVHPDKDVGRHNGKLYIGCHYDNVQRILRDYFLKKYNQGHFNHLPKDRSKVKTLVEQWLANKPLDIPHRKPPKRAPAVTRKPDEVETSIANNRKRLHESDPARFKYGFTEIDSLASSFAADDLLADISQFVIMNYLPISDLWTEISIDDKETRKMASIRESKGLDLKMDQEDDKETRKMESIRESKVVLGLKMDQEDEPSKQEIQEALMIVLTSLPYDRLREIEILAFVRLRKARPNVQSEVNHYVKAKSVSDLLGCTRTRLKMLFGRDPEEECTMEEFIKTVQLAEVQCLRNLILTVEYAERYWREMLDMYTTATTEMPQTVLGFVAQRFSQALEKAKEHDWFKRKEYFEDLDVKAQRETARWAFVKFMWVVTGVPLSMNLFEDDDGKDPIIQGGLEPSWKYFSEKSRLRILSVTRPFSKG